MNNVPLVSVCVLTHNFGDYIEDCLKGILSQKTSYSYEIIVSDDQSTDNTCDIVRQWQERYPDRIRLHTHSENVGPNRNCYDLIYLAQGKYIAWLDGDDYWIDETKLQCDIDALENHSEYSAVHSGWRDVHEATGETRDVLLTPKDWEEKLFGPEYVAKLISGERIGCRFSSLVMRKEPVIKYLESDSDIFLNVPHVHPDYVIFYILSLYGPFHHRKQLTTVYRIRKESLSMTERPAKRYHYVKAFLELIVHILRQVKVPAPIAHAKLRQLLNAILRYTFYHHLKSDALHCVRLTQQTGYKLPLVLRMLYWGSSSKAAYIALKPIFDLNYLIRG